MAAQTTTSDYEGAFRRLENELPGGPAARGARRRAFARFAGLGLPTTRLEAWKYTSLRPLARHAFLPAPQGGASIRAPQGAPVPTPLPDGAAGARLVFIDGRFHPDLSDALPVGIGFRSFADAVASDPTMLDEHDGAGALTHLNAAFATDGVVLDIADGVEAAPIHCVFHTTGRPDTPIASHIRNRVAVGRDAALTLTETYTGAGPSYWTNAVTGIVLRPGARLDHAKVQTEGGAALHVALTDIEVGAGAVYNGLALSTGAEMARNEIRAVVAGDDARLGLAGIYLGRGTQHLDNTTVVDHGALRGTTDEIYKGVLDGEATGVFQGKILVRPGAQHTDARQTNRNMLLSDRAHAHTKPELVIYADDVKCAHGATIGDLDADALFYMRARGVPEARARNLLIRGFIAELLSRAENAPMRQYLEGAAEAWLDQSSVEEVA